jgi:hypothetical protein
VELTKINPNNFINDGNSHTTKAIGAHARPRIFFNEKENHEFTRPSTPLSPPPSLTMNDNGLMDTEALLKINYNLQQQQTLNDSHQQQQYQQFAVNHCGTMGNNYQKIQTTSAAPTTTATTTTSIAANIAPQLLTTSTFTNDSHFSNSSYVNQQIVGSTPPPIRYTNGPNLSQYQKQRQSTSSPLSYSISDMISLPSFVSLTTTANVQTGSLSDEQYDNYQQQQQQHHHQHQQQYDNSSSPNADQFNFYNQSLNENDVLAAYFNHHHHHHHNPYNQHPMHQQYVTAASQQYYAMCQQHQNQMTNHFLAAASALYQQQTTSPLTNAISHQYEPSYPYGGNMCNSNYFHDAYNRPYIQPISPPPQTPPSYIAHQPQQHTGKYFNSNSANKSKTSPVANKTKHATDFHNFTNQNLKNWSYASYPKLTTTLSQFGASENSKKTV